MRTAGTAAQVLRTVLPDLRVVAGVDAAATTALAAEAVQGGAEVLAVLGGDGTMHHAVQALAGTGTALAVLPGGTGNDLAAALGGPAGPVPAARNAVRALQQGRRCAIDLDRVGGGNWFATVLCTGFDAAVSARANALRWSSGTRRYELAVLGGLARLAPRPVRIRTAEGTDTRPVTLVALGVTPSYGGGLAGVRRRRADGDAAGDRALRPGRADVLA